MTVGDQQQSWPTRSETEKVRSHLRTSKSSMVPAVTSFHDDSPAVVRTEPELQQQTKRSGSGGQATEADAVQHVFHADAAPTAAVPAVGKASSPAAAAPAAKTHGLPGVKACFPRKHWMLPSILVLVMVGIAAMVGLGAGLGVARSSAPATVTTVVQQQPPSSPMAKTIMGFEAPLTVAVTVDAMSCDDVFASPQVGERS